MSQLLNTEEITQVYSVIGGGKEATVLLAEDNQGDLVCAKVFRFYTSTIKKRLRGTKHLLASDMAILAARQEYWNLYEIAKHCTVPKPRFLFDNIVIMDFIPESPSSPLVPAPLLRDIDLTPYDPEEMFYEALDILANMFLKCRMVHGDYSEHNLMVQLHTGVLFTMDVSQSMEYNKKTFIDTPVRIRIDRAVRMLEIDIRNLNQFFKRTYNIGVNPEEIKENIIAELPSKLRGFLSERTMDIYPSELITREVMTGKKDYRDMLFEDRTGKKRQQPK
jgi:RIO kinase 1